MKSSWKTLATIGALTTTSVFALAGPLTANAASQQVETINLYSDLSGPIYGSNKNIWNNVLVPMFEKQYPNIMVNVTFGGSADSSTLTAIEASMKAKQPSPYDLVDVQSIMQPLEQLHEGVRLTTKNIPLLHEVDMAYVNQAEGQAMPYRSSWVVLLYNSQKVKNPPTTLTALEKWIQANPGQFTYNSPNTGGAGGSFVQTVVNQFIPKSDRKKFINSYNAKLETDWTKGLNYLKSLGKDMYRNGFYPNGNLAAAQLLASGSIEMTTQWSDGATDEFRGKVLPPYVKMLQLHPAFNGGPADILIPKNSAHVKASETFMNWLLTKPAQMAVYKYMGGLPGVKSQYMPAAVKKYFAPILKYNPAPWFSSDFGNDLNAKWQTVVAGAH